MQPSPALYCQVCTMDIEQLEKECSFTTTRSGGKGGQNVNKVETAVSLSWFPAESLLLTEQQKELVAEKLANRINAEGAVVIRSQIHRSQFANKQDAIEKLHTLIEKALFVKKARIVSRPGKAAKEKRLQEKKRNALIKQARSRQHWE